jgi:hypothetical protein
MLIGGENASLVPAPQLYPDAFEVLGWWDDPASTFDRKYLVMFFLPDSEGEDARREAFSRVFDALEFLMVSTRHWRQTAIAIPPEKLTRDDRLRIDEMLRAQARRNLEASFWSTDAPSEEIDAPKNSFLKVPISLLISEEPEL